MSGPFVVTAAAQRPARKDGTCFYCSAPIGAEHKADCVLVSKTVRVRLLLEYDVHVPAFWDAADVEFHRNDSSWCRDSLIAELEELAQAKGCLCRAGAKFVFVRETGPAFLDEG